MSSPSPDLPAALRSRREARLGWAPLPELFYDLIVLTGVAAFAYFFFWTFVVTLLPALLVSLTLMAIERTVR